MWNIGKAIKELREEKKLTQAELGAIFGISGKTISNYEKGDREPSLELVTKFAEYFGVTSDYLLTGNMSIATDTGEVKIKFKSGHSAAIQNKQMQDLIKMLEENKIDAEAFVQELIKRDN